MSVVVKEFEAKFRHKALGEKAVMCRRYDGRDNKFIREEVHVALVYKDNADRVIIQFWPGVTSYESFFLTSAADAVERLKSEFVPEEGMFGPTKWEHKDWNLNAGSPVYNRLCCSYGDVVEIVAFAKEVSGE